MIQSYTFRVFCGVGAGVVQGAGGVQGLSLGVFGPRGFPIVMRGVRCVLLKRLMEPDKMAYGSTAKL